MTGEEMVSEGERAVLRYSRNEKVIECVMTRLKALGAAIDLLGKRWRVLGAGEDLERIAELLEGRDLRQDVQDLKNAFAQRPALNDQLRAHGQGHMAREQRLRAASRIRDRIGEDPQHEGHCGRARVCAVVGLFDHGRHS